MPYLSPTDELTARVTSAGRSAMASLLLGEVAFRLTSFQVGRGGYETTNPVRVTTIDPNATSLIDPIGNRLDFVTIEQPIGPNIAAPICRLNAGVSGYEYGLGELGIFATWLMHDTTPELVGTDWLFALAHFPLLGKTPNHTFVWRVMIAV